MGESRFAIGDGPRQIPTHAGSEWQWVPPRLSMTHVVPGVVDVYVIRPYRAAWRVLTLQRAFDTRCPGAWESVHGKIEANETPEAAAVRELAEETGLQVERLYNVTVQPFYLHATNTIELAVVFAAFVREPGVVSTGIEHRAHEWLPVELARKRLIWPRSRSALEDIVALLKRGHAGPVEDVLRVL
jgi:dihydroneopterin triphosphate diphosphatase